MKQQDQFDQFCHEWVAAYRSSGGAIYCREGCAGCCNLAVHTTYPEASRIARELSGEQQTTLENYIDRLTASLPRQASLKDYLKIHHQRLGPCPFLGEEENCSIYAMRPLSCRALLSTRPAAWCSVDYSAMDRWDKQAYESSLDLQVVAWPTHYIAATQDFARELESSLLESMRREKGWALAGNLPVMVWLEQQFQLSKANIGTRHELQRLLAANKLDNPHLLNLSRSQATPSS